MRAVGARAALRSSAPNPASAARSVTPSFRIRAATWLSTVRTDTWSRPAISRVTKPLGDRAEHLGLATGNPGAEQLVRYAGFVARHEAIVRQRPRAAAPRRIRSADAYAATPACLSRLPRLVVRTPALTRGASKCHSQIRARTIGPGARFARNA
jgi:hypothetical protein